MSERTHWIERKSLARWAAAVAALLGIAAPASAGLLDGLRAIDINDYAVGIGVSMTESIYAGAGDSQTVYPYLTRLRPSAFDDGVVFSRDGAYGVRWVSGDGTWEAGALAKLQTLGFEAADSELFTGLQDRAWTVETGPTLGWRGPVHVDWTAFVDLLRNHHGSNHAVRLSVPRQFARGYVIPEVAFHRYSRQFVDYYYGVPAAAALPGRPAYEGEPANGFSLGIAWGVRVTPRWLLTGVLDLERFDSAISGSPLVNDDDESRFTLQVSYDGDLFEAPDAAPAMRVALDFGFAEIEADDDDAGDSLGYFEGGLRFGGRHRTAIGGFEATYARNDGPAAGRDLEIRNLQALYGYYVLDDRQKTVLVQAGVNFGQISSDGALQLFDGSLQPMPMLALDGAAHFANRFSLRARLQLLLLDGERYSGRQMFASFGVFHRTFAKASLGIGYVFNRVALTSGDAELAERVEPLHQGPSLLLTASF